MVHRRRDRHRCLPAHRPRRGWQGSRRTEALWLHATTPMSCSTPDGSPSRSTSRLTLVRACSSTGSASSTSHIARGRTSSPWTPIRAPVVGIIGCAATSTKSASIANHLRRWHCPRCAAAAPTPSWCSGQPESLRRPAQSLRLCLDTGYTEPAYRFVRSRLITARRLVRRGRSVTAVPVPRTQRVGDMAGGQLRIERCNNVENREPVVEVGENIGIIPTFSPSREPR